MEFERKRHNHAHMNIAPPRAGEKGLYMDAYIEGYEKHRIATFRGSPQTEQEDDRRIYGGKIYYNLMPTDHLAVTLSFDNGYWLKTTDGWKNISKRDAKGMQLVEPARHSLKYAKSLIQWAERYTKPLGMKLEIVPTNNPFLVKKGEHLLVTVFYEGKPLEGATVVVEDYDGRRSELVSDNDGMANIIIGKGIQIISARQRIPLKDNPDADMLSFGTVLTFEVK